MFAVSLIDEGLATSALRSLALRRRQIHISSLCVRHQYLFHLQQLQRFDYQSFLLLLLCAMSLFAMAFLFLLGGLAAKSADTLLLWVHIAFYNFWFHARPYLGYVFFHIVEIHHEIKFGGKKNLAHNVGGFFLGGG